MSVRPTGLILGVFLGVFLRQSARLLFRFTPRELLMVVGGTIERVGFRMRRLAMKRGTP